MKLKGKKTLEYILNNFQSGFITTNTAITNETSLGNTSYPYDHFLTNQLPISKGLNPRIELIDNTYYILVPDRNLCSEDAVFGDGSYGLAIEIKGNVKIDKIGCLFGGETILYVFGEEYIDEQHKLAIQPIGHTCKGMIYEFSENNEHIKKTQDIRDVNMGINAISNYLLQSTWGTGLFNINNYLNQAFEKLFEKENFKGTNVKKKILNEQM